MRSNDYSTVPVTSGRELARSGNNRQIKTAETIATVKNLLASKFKEIKNSLPKHMTPERVLRVAFNTIRHTPQLLDCAPETIVAAIVEASSLGLEIDIRGQAYLVPFRNKNTGRREVQLIIGYKGLMDLAYRSGRVDSIFAEVVCGNDKFRYTLGLNPILEHTPGLEDRGRLIAVYAVARMKDSSPQFVVMGRGDIDKIRKASRASGGPWQDWESEMWKKTAIRRLCKLLPLSPEVQRAVALDEASDAGVEQGLGENILEIPVQVEDATREAVDEGESTAPEPEPAAGELQPATDGVDQQQAAPEAGERQYACPRKDGELVEDDDCFHCPEREGCPAR